MHKGGKYGLAVLAGLLLLALLAAGCQGPKKLDNFRQVRIGWSQEQVKELLGEPDKLEEAAGLGGVWQYHGQNWYGSHDSTLIVTLLGGRVVMVTLSAPVPR
ncbi:MAG: hypothetical protein HY794_19515 [Desulfarculus sp.]|nr:hypothetical protein [Desulfarculus sp.]